MEVQLDRHRFARLDRLGERDGQRRRIVLSKVIRSRLIGRLAFRLPAKTHGIDMKSRPIEAHGLLRRHAQDLGDLGEHANVLVGNAVVGVRVEDELLDRRLRGVRPGDDFAHMHQMERHIQHDAEVIARQRGSGLGVAGRRQCGHGEDRSPES